MANRTLFVNPRPNGFFLANLILELTASSYWKFLFYALRCVVYSDSSWHVECENIHCALKIYLSHSCLQNVTQQRRQKVVRESGKISIEAPKEILLTLWIWGEVSKQLFKNWKLTAAFNNQKIINKNCVANNKIINRYSVSVIKEVIKFLKSTLKYIRNACHSITLYITWTKHTSSDHIFFKSRLRSD